MVLGSNGKRYVEQKQHSSKKGQEPPMISNDTMTEQNPLPHSGADRNLAN